MKSLAIFCLVSVLIVSGCITVPKQAPSLSEELGLKISSIEDSHIILLHNFFDQKREIVDQYIVEKWIPHFSNNIFNNPDFAEIWDEVMESDDKNDRLQFIIRLGSKLQTKINNKRLELIKPLDDLEREIEMKIREEYNVARNINNTLTSFLYSASKVDENRQRYLDMLGITDKKINEALNTTNEVVQNLVDKSEDVMAKEKQVKEYIEKLKDIKSKIIK